MENWKPIGWGKAPASVRAFLVALAVLMAIAARVMLDVSPEAAFETRHVDKIGASAFLTCSGLLVGLA